VHYKSFDEGIGNIYFDSHIRTLCSLFVAVLAMVVLALRLIYLGDLQMLCNVRELCGQGRKEEGNRPNSPIS